MKIVSSSCFVPAILILLLGRSGISDVPAETLGTETRLTIFFDNVAGNEELKLETASFKNAAGEPFTISQLQYFISNIELTNTDGTVYKVPQDSSYFLIQESDPATQQIHLQVPAGNYKRLGFILGIDSVRNTMDISQRTGVLDPASSMDNGMYWGWNSGYIFFKMEGSSAAAPEDPAGRQKFRYHIGGFGGYSAPTINNIKPITVELSNGIATVGTTKETLIHLKADVLKVFDGPEKVSIAAHPSVMFSQYSTKIAGNYSHMFSHYRTEN